jgi:hypothetical protein
VTNSGSECGIFPAGAVRVSSTFEAEPNVAGLDATGYVVEGDNLYLRSYNHDAGIDQTTRIGGGGWKNFTALEVSHFAQGKTSHWMAYGLRNDGTVLLGIDKDTGSGYLYAVGHANGTATVINSLGKVNGTFPDPVYLRWGIVFNLDQLNGD